MNSSCPRGYGLIFAMLTISTVQGQNASIGPHSQFDVEWNGLKSQLSKDLEDQLKYLHQFPKAYGSIYKDVENRQNFPHLNTQHPEIIKWVKEDTEKLVEVPCLDKIPAGVLKIKIVGAAHNCPNCSAQSQLYTEQNANDEIVYKFENDNTFEDPIFEKLGAIFTLNQSMKDFQAMPGKEEDNAQEAIQLIFIYLRAIAASDKDLLSLLFDKIQSQSKKSETDRLIEILSYLRTDFASDQKTSNAMNDLYEFGGKNSREFWNIGSLFARSLSHGPELKKYLLVHGKKIPTWLDRMSVLSDSHDKKDQKLFDLFAAELFNVHYRNVIMTEAFSSAVCAKLKEGFDLQKPFIAEVGYAHAFELAAMFKKVFTDEYKIQKATITVDQQFVRHAKSKAVERRKELDSTLNQLKRFSK